MYLANIPCLIVSLHVFIILLIGILYQYRAVKAEGDIVQKNVMST